MKSKNSETSKGFRARLKERGGATLGVALSPDTAAIVESFAAEWRRSRNWTINELIRIGNENRGAGNAK